MSYEQKYNKLVEAVKVLQETNPSDEGIQNWVNENVPELKESEDERIRKYILSHFQEHLNKTKEFISEGLTPPFSSKEIEMLQASVAWLEKQGEKNLPPINERAWLYLVCDVLTWKDGIGQYLDDPRVQELAKKLCSEYAQKLYNSPVLSNSSNK